MTRLGNLFTTIIGTIIIISTLIFIYKDKASFTEASGFITIGIALLFSKDEHFAKNFLPFLFKETATTENENQPLN